MSLTMEEKLDAHMKEESSDLHALREDMHKLMTNHLAHVQASLDDHSVSLTGLKVQMTGVLWFLSIICGATIVSIIGSIFALILRK